MNAVVGLGLCEESYIIIIAHGKAHHHHHHIHVQSVVTHFTLQKFSQLTGGY